MRIDTRPGKLSPATDKSWSAVDGVDALDVEIEAVDQAEGGMDNRRAFTPSCC
ncbi:hypothetical protein [Kitasatospora sp. NPDC002965]|uniref:hypothetical protein n=1 Tax=Kitasatospora sp. NPDC002965 TaxID=3154775 RepID=UPI0033ABEB57